MSNEVRRAEIERMRKKSQEAENRNRFWRRCHQMVQSVGWQIPAALGAAVIAGLYYQYKYAT